MEIEKQQSAGSRMPLTGMELEMQACALTRDQTGDIMVLGMILNQLSNIGQGLNLFFKWKYKRYIKLLKTSSEPL